MYEQIKKGMFYPMWLSFGFIGGQAVFEVMRWMA